MQAVVWQSNGTVELSQQDTLHVSAPCVVSALVVDDGWDVYVSDPSRELEALTLTVERAGSAVEPTPSSCAWTGLLPTGGAAGSSVRCRLQCWSGNV